MLEVSFIMICIIHKILLLHKITEILKHFLMSIIENNYFFSQHIKMENPRAEKEGN